MRNYFSIFLRIAGAWLLVGAGSALAQSWRGQVRTPEAEPVPFAHVVNLRSLAGAYTDEEGFFRLAALPGDSVWISAVGFRRLRLVVTEALLQAPTPDPVLLYPEIQTLPMVTIEAPRQALKIAGVPSYDGPLRASKSIYFGSNSPPDPTAMQLFGPTIGISGPFTMLYDRFGRQGRLQRRLAQVQTEKEKADAYADLWASRVQRQQVAEWLAIGGDTLDAFLRTFTPTAEWLRRASDYELILELRRQYARFEEKVTSDHEP